MCVPLQWCFSSKAQYRYRQQVVLHSQQTHLICNSNSFRVHAKPPVLEWWTSSMVNTKKGQIHISSRSGSTDDASSCHHTILCLILYSWVTSSLMRGLKKMVMKFFPRGHPRNKQLFSQKSLHYPRTLFLLCPQQGPPGWESCGCGVKNNISMSTW